MKACSHSQARYGKVVQHMIALHSSLHFHSVYLNAGQCRPVKLSFPTAVYHAALVVSISLCLTVYSSSSPLQIAGRLPVDLMLGRFVSLGVAVGLSSEAVIVAAALSLPKSPFRIISTHIQSDPDEYNK